ncbi:hypothetical protein [Streptomyces sp. NPDC091215]
MSDRSVPAATPAAKRAPMVLTAAEVTELDGLAARMVGGRY